MTRHLAGNASQSGEYIAPRRAHQLAHGVSGIRPVAFKNRLANQSVLFDRLLQLSLTPTQGKRDRHGLLDKRPKRAQDRIARSREDKPVKLEIGLNELR